MRSIEGIEGLEVRICHGAELPALIPALAALRVSVFHDWPYIYAGDEAYEAVYLQSYVKSPSAAIIVASDGGTIIGASTCLRLAEETENIQAPFSAQGWDISRFFYYGESVLLPEYRGRGIGVAFFEAREVHARATSNCDFAAFCSVIRPESHPARPPGFQPLDAFWTKRGYIKRPDLVCHMAWTDLGDQHETRKSLVVWMKSLTGVPLP